MLSRVLDQPGPVLVDFGDARMGFFVPAGTAARRLGTGVRTAGLGTWIVVPHPGGAVRWLIPPEEARHLARPARPDDGVGQLGPVREPGASEGLRRVLRPTGQELRETVSATPVSSTAPRHQLATTSSGQW